VPVRCPCPAAGTDESGLWRVTRKQLVGEADRGQTDREQTTDKTETKGVDPAAEVKTYCTEDHPIVLTSKAVSI
jgi:hypothetical protein